MPTGNTKSPIREAWDAAKARGDRTFTVPFPCARGHTAERYTSNGICSACSKAGNQHRFNPELRKRKLMNASGKFVQVKQDKETAELGETISNRIKELTGQAVS